MRKAIRYGSAPHHVYSGCGIFMLLMSFGMTALASGPPQVSELLKEGEAFHARADYKHSIPILRKAVVIAPKNYQANLLLGVDLLRTGNVSEAMVHLKVAVEVSPKDGDAAEVLAKASVEAGDFAMAAEVLEAAVQGASKRVKPVQSLAGYSLERFRILGDRLRATKAGEGVELRVEAATLAEGSKVRVSLLEEAANDDSDQRGIWGELGVAQFEVRNRAGVEASLHEAQKREPDGAETWRLEALLAAAEGRWRDAEDLLLSLGARSPAQLKGVLAKWVPALQPGKDVQGAVWDCLRNPEVLCQMTTGQPEDTEGAGAKVLYAQGRWEQLAMVPQEANWGKTEWLWRGVALAEIGKCQQAIPSLERSLGDGDETFGVFWLEICYASEAERAAGLLSVAGAKAALHQLRGDVFLRIGLDAARAEEQYAEALKLRPNDTQLLVRSAEGFVVLGQMDRARKLLLSALAIDPQEDSALRALVNIEISQRDYKEVVAPLKQLSVLHPGEVWPSVELGRAYAQLNKPEQAVHCLKPALAGGYPDEKGALHAILAKALRRVGREDEARQAAIEAARLANTAQGSGGGVVHEQ